MLVGYVSTILLVNFTDFVDKGRIAIFIEAAFHRLNLCWRVGVEKFFHLRNIPAYAPRTGNSSAVKAS